LKGSTVDCFQGTTDRRRQRTAIVSWKAQWWTVVGWTCTVDAETGTSTSNFLARPFRLVVWLSLRTPLICTETECLYFRPTQFCQTFLARHFLVASMQRFLHEAASSSSISARRSLFHFLSLLWYSLYASRFLRRARRFLCLSAAVFAIVLKSYRKTNVHLNRSQSTSYYQPKWFRLENFR